MSKSVENRSSEKSTEANGINDSRNLIRGLLLGISIGFVSGIAIGKWVGGNDKKPEDDKPLPCTVTPDDKPSFAYENLRKRIDEMNKIKKAVPDFDSDKEVCEMSDDEILDESYAILIERREEEALKFIAKLGITNQNDKDSIIDAFLRGYTQVDDVSKGDISLIKKDEFDSDEGQYEFVDLEEEIEVPEEYLDEDDMREKTPEEIEMEKLVKDGKFEEALDYFDADEILKSAQQEGVYNEFLELLNLLERAKFSILSTNDPDKKKMIACGFFFKLMSFVENHPDLMDNNNLKFADEMIGFFVQSLMELSGLEDENECFEYILKSGADCIFNQ